MAAGSKHGVLSSFPYLTNDEFESGCRAFLHRVQVAGRLPMPWSSVRFQANGQILKICQILSPDYGGPARSLQTEDTADLQLEAWEEDSEALIRTSNSCELQVDYDILLSPTYQVPVLYFVLRRTDKSLGLDEVYDYLVPDQCRRYIRNMGIIGGISFGYHPIFETPAFFVHPCNTADAMREIASEHDISPEAYLIIWLGLVGSPVRLQLSSELFKSTGIPKPNA
ncbi:hypothetical protein BDW60DRAFT_224058 [Aspergillus nidulans var. acristatus]